MMILIIGLVLQAIQLLSVLYLAYRYIQLKEQKENEYYTDYVHNNLILRVYKSEYEYQAAGNIKNPYLLDRGRLSPLYDWVLIDKRGLEVTK